MATNHLRLVTSRPGRAHRTAYEQGDVLLVLRGLRMIRRLNPRLFRQQSRFLGLMLEDQGPLAPDARELAMSLLQRFPEASK
jgi:hypothetical protein